MNNQTTTAPMTDDELALIRSADARDRATEAGRRSPAVRDRERLLGEVDRLRAENARLAAQDRASGPNTPDPYTGEGTAPASPHEPAQAAIDTIARILVGTDWDEEVPYTDIGPRETVAHLAGQIATVLAPAHYREAAASLRALGHDTAADLLEYTAPARTSIIRRILGATRSTQ